MVFPGIQRLVNTTHTTSYIPRYPETRHHYFDVSGSGLGRVTHLRLNMFPDGGIARLRVHGKVMPDWDKLPAGSEVDLCSVLNGGRGVSCSSLVGRHATRAAGKSSRAGGCRRLHPICRCVPHGK